MKSEGEGGGKVSVWNKGRQRWMIRGGVTERERKNRMRYKGRKGMRESVRQIDGECETNKSTDTPL